MAGCRLESPSARLTPLGNVTHSRICDVLGPLVVDDQPRRFRAADTGGVVAFLADVRWG